MLHFLNNFSRLPCFELNPISSELVHFIPRATAAACLRNCHMITIGGNTLIHALAKGYVRTLIALSCLYVKYELHMAAGKNSLTLLEEDTLKWQIISAHQNL